MGVDTAAADRLPWLADEPARRPVKHRPRPGVLPLAAVAVAIVAAAGFWLDSQNAHDTAHRTMNRPQRTLTVPLPPPHVAVSPEVRMPVGREVSPAPAPEVRPAPPREVHLAAPPRAKTAAREEAKARHDEAAPETSATRPHIASTLSSTPKSVPSSAVAGPSVLPRPWNPRVFAGAAGRVVQIGAFGSVHQAKRGWWFMVRAHPAMARLPAVVRPARNSKGRVFYRFQVGTTSQAHSEVLCQRMLKIQLSCAVVGLPWKAKVER